MYYLGRKFFILLGIVWGTFGIFVMINPAFYSSYLNQYIDLTDSKWGVGTFFIILGGAFIWSSFRRGAFEAEMRKKDMEKVLMCSGCIKPYQKKELRELKCPECGWPLEDLEGFYERHPNLK